MREKLTVIKVGGKIVEEEATLNQLLNDLQLLEDKKSLFMEEGDRPQRLQPNLALKVKW